MEEMLKLLQEDPTSVKEIIDEYVETFKPLVYSVGNICLDIANDYAENKRLPEIMAKIKYNQFNAYIQAGFEEDQAISLLVADTQAFLRATANGCNIKSK